MICTHVKRPSTLPFWQVTCTRFVCVRECDPQCFVWIPPLQETHSANKTVCVVQTESYIWILLGGQHIGMQWRKRGNHCRAIDDEQCNPHVSQPLFLTVQKGQGLEVCNFWGFVCVNVLLQSGGERCLPPTREKESVHLVRYKKSRARLAPLNFAQ